MSVTFVAEVSSNHHRDLNRCLAFIDASAKIGCSAVKFQLFKIAELFAPEILFKSETHRKREHWELPVKYLPDLAARCREQGIAFSCTPFYLDAVEELYPYVDFYKIASYELLWDDLLIACAKTDKPIVLSTGMATMDEIQHAVEVTINAFLVSNRDKGSETQNLTLLHCVSGYPTPPEQCNLAAMQTLRNSFNCKVGWSDHSVSPAVINRAVHKWGASMIEFHLDLDGEGAEFSSGHCWLPSQIAPVIQDIAISCSADGNGEKTPSPVELKDREWRADPIDGLRPLRSIRSPWND